MCLHVTEWISFYKKQKLTHVILPGNQWMPVYRDTYLWS